MTRRSGMTLIEVLVAIFIMAIGMLALLTLFPLGMLRMMAGIRDQRTGQCASDAFSIATAQNIRNDGTVVSEPADLFNTNLLGNPQPNPDVFQNPYPMKKGVPQLTNADPYGESYPILVDPPGYNAALAPDWVGNIPGYLRRRKVSFATTATTINKNFTLWDDINFERVFSTGTVPGAPESVTGASVSRDTRYSWGYLFKRPQTSDKSVVDCTVIVFDQRSLSLTNVVTNPLATNPLALEEFIYDNFAYFNPTNGTISLDYTTRVPPPLRAGDWILDITLNSKSVTRVTTPGAHAYFYRVSAVEDLGTNQTVLGVPGRSVMRFEVQSPLRGFHNPTDPAPYNAAMTDGTFGYSGTAIVIRGIAEVFEKGPVRLP